MTSTSVAIFSLITACISAFVMLRGQKLGFKSNSQQAENHQVQVIFDGYNKIVEDLRYEVERLTLSLEVVQEEMLLCDDRNKKLSAEITTLTARINELEVRDGFPRGK
jgi:peptidoglycan hydrolase CwlO-like protein